MKMIITGASGQLGKQIRSIIEKGTSELGNIDPVYNRFEIKYLDSEELDIANQAAVLDFLCDFKPDIIINCAAYTNVDSCESDEENAFKVNSIGPRNLAMGAEKVEAKLIHVSTDYVFKGNGAVPYKEYDIPHPVTVYGKTKFLGEQYVREYCTRYFIVRTAWLYGKYGKNFVYTIINAAKEKRYLEVVNDQVGNPTNAEDLAYHILKLALTDQYGVYHCTGEEQCSWYEFAKQILDYADINCTIKPITSNKLNRPAKRPSFSALHNMMLSSISENHMRNWQDALKSFIESLNN